MKYCFYCGKSIPVNAQYCGACGKEQEKIDNNGKQEKCQIDSQELNEDNSASFSKSKEVLLEKAASTTNSSPGLGHGGEENKNKKKKTTGIFLSVAFLASIILLFLIEPQVKSLLGTNVAMVLSITVFSAWIVGFFSYSAYILNLYCDDYKFPYLSLVITGLYSFMAGCILFFAPKSVGSFKAIHTFVNMGMSFGILSFLLTGLLAFWSYRSFDALHRYSSKKPMLPAWAAALIVIVPGIEWIAVIYILFDIYRIVNLRVTPTWRTIYGALMFVIPCGGIFLGMINMNISFMFNSMAFLLLIIGITIGGLGGSVNAVVAKGSVNEYEELIEDLKAKKIIKI